MSRMIEDFASASMDDGDRVAVRFPPGKAGDALTEKLERLGAEVMGRGPLSRADLGGAIRRFGAEWVLLVTGAFPPSSRVGWMLHGHGVPILETLRAMPKRRRIKAGQKLLYFVRGASRYRLLVINDDMEASCVNFGGRIRRAVVRVPNGINLPAPPDGPRSIEAGTLRMVSHSRLDDRNKDHETALRALALVDEPGVTLTLLGEGPDRAKLESITAELGLQSRVSFGGFVENVMERLPEFDAELLSTKGEGLPRVAVEAMAFGLPVIGTDVHGVRDVVVPDSNGLLVPPRDHEALADAIRQLAGDPALYARLSERAPSDAGEHDHRRTGRVIRWIAEDLLG